MTGIRDAMRRWTPGKWLIDLRVILPDGSSIEVTSKKGANHSPEMIRHAAAILALWLGIDDPLDIGAGTFAKAQGALAAKECADA